MIERMENIFEKQLQQLLALGYPKIVGMDEETFITLVEPLKKKIEKLPYAEIDMKKGYLPFVIVVKNKDAEKAMSLIKREGKQGMTKLYPHTAADFNVREDVHIPDTNAYVLVDIDRGKDTIHIPPYQALLTMQQHHRSPLTIDEGIAILLQYPEFLMRNNCFSLLASRVAGNQRVPAIWINSQNQPNLGWCWDGNPHTWLGSASCKERLTV